MKVLATIAVFAQEEHGNEFEAPNKWLPEAAEILWGTIAFVIIVFLLWKFAYKPIAAMLRGRTQRIADELDGAAKAKNDAEADVTRIRQNLADVDTERARILAEANKTAERLKVDGVIRNDAEVAALEARAAGDLAALRTRASGELQSQVAAWSAEATERIVLTELDPDTLERLVEDTIAKIGVAR
jgi:F-type H+-transporting ATPase subunit b